MEKSKHSNREKRVDTSLSETATEDLIKFKDDAVDNKAIIFFTGILRFLLVFIIFIRKQFINTNVIIIMVR